VEETRTSKWGAQLRFVGALVATSLRAALALRGAFLLQAAFMLANNCIFFAVWWIFFRNFREVNGWRFAEITALYAIVSGGYGLSTILAGGVRTLARRIVDGDLDAFMTQPKSLLLHAVASYSSPAGWGDLVTLAVLIYFSGYASHWALVTISLLCGTVLFTASGILIHSLAFWAGEIDNLARQAVEWVITFSVYPQTIFTGAMRVMLFTVIPAGFIGYLPVELLRAFRPELLVFLLAGTLAYAALACFVFARGLRRYESGNRFGVRA